MKIIHLNQSSTDGGAARAAYRIHKSLLYQNVESRLFSNSGSVQENYIIYPSSNFHKISVFIKQKFEVLIVRFLNKSPFLPKSFSIFTSRYPKILNNTDTDIINLHWINNGMISIKDISKIKKPIVWTLHDMWPFCGTDHYTDSDYWKKASLLNNSIVHKTFIDEIILYYKKNCWEKPITIITPSNWLANCVKESNIMNKWPVYVIPNPIDCDVWKPIDQNFCRQCFGLSPDTKVILYGAIGGIADPRKGFRLLKETLTKLNNKSSEYTVLIFGSQIIDHEFQNLGFKIIYLGHLYDDLTLNIAYCAADVTIVPSIKEAFGQTASESITCGTPVIAFGATGLLDIICHKYNGYLVKPFDTDDMAGAILWIFSSKEKLAEIKVNCRKFALDNFSYSVVSKKYLEVYNSILQ